MTCDYNTSKCSPSLPESDYEAVVRQILTITSASTGMNKMTDKNWLEWYIRLNTIEKFFGRMIVSVGEERYISPSDVKRWVGMTTNSSPLSRAQFLKSISKHMDREIRLLAEDDR